MVDLVCRPGETGARVAGVRDALVAAVARDRARGAVDLTWADDEHVRTLRAAVDPQHYDEGLGHAVRAFQQSRGLIADGVVGAETALALQAAGWHLGDRPLSLVPGALMHGDDVAELQARLIGLGFGPERVDGVFGVRTDQAVRAFQRGRGEVVDGVVGPETLAGFVGLRRSVTGGSPQGLREREQVRRSGSRLMGRVVVLDPGHGGADLGVVRHGLVEAELVLDLAHRVQQRLVSLGVQVVLTRGTEDGGDQVQRAGRANAVGADLVLSLHCDSADHEEASGIATFFYGLDRFGAWSAVGERFADLLQRELVSRSGLSDSRSHPRAWPLLQRTEMPAVWLEVGYASNPRDAERLADPAVLDSLAEGIVVAVQRVYFGDDDATATGVLDLRGLRDLAITPKSR